MATPRAARLAPLLVVLLPVALYLQTAWFDFAWDDKLAITANEYTLKGAAGLGEIFTRRVSVPYKSEYRPVPQALHAVEYQLSGGTPAVGHLFNVLWYAVGCVLVMALIRFTFPRAHPLFALAAAGLFAVHPLHVEVVANIKGRDEILALVFGVSGVMLLVRAIERARGGLAVAGAACFAAACLSKANAVTLLPLVGVVAWYRAPGLALSRRAAVSLGAIAGCGIALVAAIRHLQNTVSASTTLHLDSTVLNNIFLWTTHPEAVVPTSLVNIGRYLRLFVFPHPLIHLYGYDQIPLSRWSDPGPWIVVAALAGTAVVLLRSWRQKGVVLFGCVWCAITYSAYSNFFFFAPDTMADRYMFLPSVGVALLAAYGLFRLGGIDPAAPSLATRRARLAGAGWVAALVAFAATSAAASRDWRNDTTLIENRIQYMERNAAAQAVYGNTLVRESYGAGDPDIAMQRRAAAMRAFTQAIRIYPDFQSAWIAVGKLFAEQGIFDKAELAFLKAQRLAPLNPDSYFCLGTLYLARQDLTLAIPYLEKAVLLDPKAVDGYVSLGRAYLQGGQIPNLGAMVETARRWFPESVDLEALEAAYYFRSEQYDRAFARASDVAGKDPQNVLVLSILASPLMQGYVTGRPAPAPGPTSKER